jgi:hypothetical protein
MSLIRSRELAISEQAWIMLQPHGSSMDISRPLVLGFVRKFTALSLPCIYSAAMAGGAGSFVPYGVDNHWVEGKNLNSIKPKDTNRIQLVLFPLKVT